MFTILPKLEPFWAKNTRFKRYIAATVNTLLKFTIFFDNQTDPATNFISWCALQSNQMVNISNV